MSKVPYLKPEYTRTFFIEWQLFDDAQGCAPLQHDGLCLQMHKSPPALPLTAEQARTKAVAAPVTKTPAPPPPPKKETAQVFLEWMIERREKKHAQAQPQTQGKPQPTLPKPFDLYDIPAAMKSAGFTVSAQLAQKWLDGPAFTAYGTDDPGTAKERRYPPHLVDHSTVSLGWLRGYPKIEQRYQALLRQLTSPNALRELRKNFTKYLTTYPGLDHDLSTREHSQSDWQALHEQFQFQLEPVGMLDTLTDTLGMTDVTASLANFNFYAAVARAHIQTDVYNRYNTPTGTQHCMKSTVTVSHVWVYAKDRYSFHDAGQSSQYLGHWNKKGVIVLPAAVAASVGMAAAAAAIKPYWKEGENLVNALRIELWNEKLAHLPVDIGKKMAEGEVYYPVRNRDYRQWRKVKQRGGDFLIMTEPKLIRLDQPIVLGLAEVCK
jgi:hypothetical protein